MIIFVRFAELYSNKSTKLTSQAVLYFATDKRLKNASNLLAIYAGFICTRKAMNKLTCPSCNNEAMSHWEKLFLSPITSYKCNNCKLELTVPFIGIILCMLPTPILLFMIPSISAALVMGLIPVTTCLSLFLVVNSVPLIVAK